MEERLPSFKEIVEDESFIRWVKNNSWQDANDWEEKIRQNPRNYGRYCGRKEIN